MERKTTSNLSRVKPTFRTILNQAQQKADLTFTELGINFDRTIVEVDLTKLKSAPYHSRVPIDSRLKSIKDSLEDFGFVGAIFISSSTYHIIDGFYRKEIWALLGHETIPCFIINCTENQEKLLHLKLNIQIATFDLSDFGLTFPGLNLVEDFGFTAADLHAAQQSPSRSEKATKSPINTSLMRFNTLLQTEQYQRLKAFKEQNALQNWADVIDMLLEGYEAN